MKLLVTGSRAWIDKPTIEAHLRALHHCEPLTVVIHGAARGADTMAGDVAYDLGVPQLSLEADWGAHKSIFPDIPNPAGHIRNQRMLDEGEPDRCLAFSFTDQVSGGTLDMLNRARDAGLPVAVVYPGSKVADLVWHEKTNFGLTMPKVIKPRVPNWFKE